MCTYFMQLSSVWGTHICTNQSRVEEQRRYKPGKKPWNSIKITISYTPLFKYYYKRSDLILSSSNKTQLLVLVCGIICEEKIVLLYESRKYFKLCKCDILKELIVLLEELEFNDTCDCYIIRFDYLT